MMLLSANDGTTKWPTKCQRWVSIKDIQKSFFPIKISNGIREDIGV
jgi:hypothetical protein